VGLGDNPVFLCIFLSLRFRLSDKVVFNSGSVQQVLFFNRANFAPVFT